MNWTRNVHPEISNESIDKIAQKYIAILMLFDLTKVDVSDVEQYPF